jgi:hypothetical protein
MLNHLNHDPFSDPSFNHTWDSPEIVHAMIEEKKAKTWFTPGPWEVLYSHSDHAMQIVTEKSGTVTKWGGISRPASLEGKANAALIAAAPDMYEALKETLEELQSAACGKANSEEGISNELHERLSGIFQRAEAALSKAIDSPNK